MSSVPPDRSNRPSRRSFLAAAGGLTAALSGCTDYIPSSLNPISQDGLSLSITTLPADGDREAIQVARHLRSNLEEAGITASIDMRPRSEYFSKVMYGHDFDLFVGELLDVTDPDYLYGTLHSSLAEEGGWQNPFGFTSRTFDRLLEGQRTAAEDDRQAAVENLADALLAELPFLTICRPHEYRVASPQRVEGWADQPLHEAAGYLGLETGPGVEELGALMTDTGPSRQINPFTAPHRDRELVVSLIHDSLVRLTPDGVEPWLAASLAWDDEETLSVTLREDLHFHDGVSLTAEDVAFSVRLARDTTLGNAPVPVPAPRYRGRVLAIDEIEVSDRQTLHVTSGASQSLVERALAIPVVPRHHWETAIESLAEDVDDPEEYEYSIHDLIDDEVEPIGSGPYIYADNSEREYLQLERFTDHFTMRDDVERPAPTVPTIEIGIDPSSLTTIEQVAGGVADVSVSPLAAYALDEVINGSRAGVETVRAPTRAVYILGFNTRSVPLSDPAVRHAIAGCIDKDWLVEGVFDGHAEPATVPLADEWVPEHLAWDGEDPVTPFFGENGRFDAETARETFRRTHMAYDDGFLDPDP